jgi:hypothetical protein
VPPKLTNGAWRRFVLLALKFGLLLVGLLEIIEIFEEQDPGSLFGVIKFCSAAGLFPQDVIDILEGLFEHSDLLP